MRKKKKMLAKLSHGQLNYTHKVTGHYFTINTHKQIDKTFQNKNSRNQLI